MTNPYLQEIKSELNLAITQKNHPLKFCVLSSIGLDNTPQTRIIGFKKVSDNFKFTVFTDARSNKIAQIKENRKVGILFYHPQKKLQIKINGIASIVKDQDVIDEKWAKISPEAQKDYTSAEAPGSKLTDTKTVKYLKGTNHFCILEIQAQNIEYLKLKEASHFKVEFHQDINGWVSQFLVP